MKRFFAILLVSMFVLVSAIPIAADDGAVPNQIQLNVTPGDGNNGLCFNLANLLSLVEGDPAEGMYEFYFDVEHFEGKAAYKVLTQDGDSTPAYVRYTDRNERDPGRYTIVTGSRTDTADGTPVVAADLVAASAANQVVVINQQGTNANFVVYNIVVKKDGVVIYDLQKDMDVVNLCGTAFSESTYLKSFHGATVEVAEVEPLYNINVVPGDGNNGVCFDINALLSKSYNDPATGVYEFTFFVKHSEGMAAYKVLTQDGDSTPAYVRYTDRNERSPGDHVIVTGSRTDTADGSPVYADNLAAAAPANQVIVLNQQGTNASFTITNIVIKKDGVVIYDMQNDPEIAALAGVAFADTSFLKSYHGAALTVVSTAAEVPTVEPTEPEPTTAPPTEPQTQATSQTEAPTDAPTEATTVAQAPVPDTGNTIALACAFLLLSGCALITYKKVYSR